LNRRWSAVARRAAGRSGWCRRPAGPGLRAGRNGRRLVWRVPRPAAAWLGPGRAAGRARTGGDGRSANGPPLRVSACRGFLSRGDLDELAVRSAAGRTGSGGGGSLMCFIATVNAPSPVNGRLPEIAFVAKPLPVHYTSLDGGSRRGPVPARGRDCTGRWPITMPVCVNRGGRPTAFGDAEVGDLHLAGRGDQDCLPGLDVAVHQTGGGARPAGPVRSARACPACAAATARPVRLSTELKWLARLTSSITR